MHREVYAGPLVIIRVGAEEVEYRVHQTLFTHYSGYFHTFQTEMYIFSSTSPRTLEVFLDWIYSRDLPEEESADELMQLYLLADHLHVPDLKLHGLRLLFNHFNVSKIRPGYSIVILAYERLHKGDPVLRLLVDAHCCAWAVDNDHDEDEQNLFHQLPHDFLYGLVRNVTRFFQPRAKGVRQLQLADYCE